jgi:hypothetical protein
MKFAHPGVTFILAIGTALVTVFAVLVMAAPIEPLLPPAGRAACFATRPNELTKVALTDGPTAKTSSEVVEQLFFRLERRADQMPQRVANGYSFDWLYDFSVTARLRGRGTLYGGGQCAWVADAGSHWQFDLACFKDCEGGSLDLYRVPFSRSLILIWNYLRMHGCGNPGVTVRSAAMPTWFNLGAIPEQDCQK